MHWDVERNVCGNLILPGFKNAHTHSAMTFLRSYADDLPLPGLAQQTGVPDGSQADPRRIFIICPSSAYLEYLTSGITANFDMYLTPDSIVQSSIDTGFRTVLTGAVNDFSQSAALVGEWYQKYNGYHPLISFELGFHAEYTTSRNILEDLAALAHLYQAPVYTHNSETAGEVASCMEKHGMTPTQYLDSLHLFDFGGGGYHCVHFTPEDLQFSKSAACPSSPIRLPI